MKKGHYLFDGNKLLWHMDRVHEHYRGKKRIYPLHIDIGATKVCNAKCTYCYGLFQKMTGEIIPADVLVQLFKDAPDLGIRSLTLTGDGEPTLNPAVYQAIYEGHARGLDIGFATNGISLNKARITTLLESCTWLRFNLSAVDKGSYKTIHGVDRWERVQDNIITTTKLKKKIGSECTVGLQMVLIPDCLDQVLPEYKFAIAHGLDYFVIKQFSDPDCKEMSQFDLSWYNNVETEVILKMAEFASTEQTKIIPKWNTIASKGKRPYDHCVDCPLIFQISGNSKCYPCGFLFNNEEYCYGDLKKNTLKEILDSEHYWSIIRKMRYEFDVHTQCVGCCRHDSTNAFVWNYLHAPTHLSFI